MTAVAVYAGENAVGVLLTAANDENASHMVTLAGAQITLPVERKFGCLDSLQRYCDMVLALPSIREAWPMAKRPVRVRERKGQTKAVYEPGGVLAIPLKDRWAMREIVVLHELAHHLAVGDGHGPEFRRAFCDLARVVMAPEVAWALQVSWSLEGVA